MKRRIAIIAYHSISPGREPFALSPGSFRRHMEIIRERFGIVRLGEVPAAFGDPDIRARVVITFDDGFEDFIHYAYPTLRELSIPATMFVPSGLVGKWNVWDAHRPDHRKRPVMTVGQLRYLSDDGLVDIGSHTVDHVSMGRIPHDGMYAQIHRSKEDLEHLLHREIEAFSYPYGQLDDVCGPARRMLAEAGYRTAVTTHWGTMQDSRSMLDLRRIFFTEEDTDRTVADKIEGYYDWIAVKERIGFLIRSARTRLKMERTI